PTVSESCKRLSLFTDSLEPDRSARPVRRNSLLGRSSISSSVVSLRSRWLRRNGFVADRVLLDNEPSERCESFGFCSSRELQLDAMDAAEFRRCGKQLIDFIADYIESLNGNRREAMPRVLPGYLRQRLPLRPPDQPETWERVMSDVEEHILSGTAHWLHPDFNAYFPIGISYASVLGDLLSSSFGVGFTWRSNPALTELERLMLDWLAEMMGMPAHFRNDSGIGGGALQGSASDCVLVSMLAARKEKLTQLIGKDAEPLPVSRLVAYCSQLAHPCVDKAAVICGVRLRRLGYDDENLALRCDLLESAVLEDRQLGLVPFYVCAVLGTTACASCDNLSDVGAVCHREQLWCHVDAAYSGGALVCPEFRPLLQGIELVDSFNFNPSKWLLCTFDASVLWVKSQSKLKDAFVSGPRASIPVDDAPISNPLEQICDLKDWGIPLSRRFRSLKLWFVIRLYGVEGLQRHIRLHCRLAQSFESQLLKDGRFQLAAKTRFSLVCFRFRDSDALSRLLVCRINQSRDLHLMPASVRDRYIIRYAIVRERAVEADVNRAIRVILKHADQLDGKFSNAASIASAIPIATAVATSGNAVNDSEDAEEPVELNSSVPIRKEPSYMSDDLIVGLSEDQLQEKFRQMSREFHRERRSLRRRLDK
uniref:Aromatic-L-amino-acid decarboxylase n=1 Tax=Macrostomum lignano TaxID=282301 RepID=A0A1I8FRG2_9PLAT